MRLGATAMPWQGANPYPGENQSYPHGRGGADQILRADPEQSGHIPAFGCGGGGGGGFATSPHRHKATATPQLKLVGGGAPSPTGWGWAGARR
jgi:hypothetical protein